MNESKAFALAADLCKQYREVRNLKQTELADLAGVNVRTIRKLERNQPVNMETLQKIMKACGHNFVRRATCYVRKSSKKTKAPRCKQLDLFDDS